MPRIMRNIITLAALTLVAIPAAIADTIPKAVYQKIDKEYMDAIVRVSYSIEITNQNTGETSRRASYTSGTLVSEDGLLIAYGHMALENRMPVNIKVIVGYDDEEEEYDATLLKKPDDININFLQIENDDNRKFPYIRFKNIDGLELGDQLLTVGLLNQNFDYAKAIQTRRIGAVLQEPRLTYALDSTVTFGFIGGPVFGTSGDPIGVVGFDLSSNEGGDIYTRSGYPLLYHTGLFEKYIKNPPSEEDVEAQEDDAYLGVFTQPLTKDFAEYWGLPDEGGVIVSTVISGSPAHAAGFNSGDVITKFGDNPVTAKQDQDVVAFTKMVRESELETPLPILFYRDGKQQELKLTLTTRPTAGKDANEFEDDVFGITARELTTDARIALNLSDEVQGVIIRAVKSGSPASLGRLRRNYVIQAIGDYRIANLEDFQNAITELKESKPAEIPVFCRVGANTAFFRMQPRWTN